MNPDFEIVIVGSGLVGSSLAIALSGSGRSVLLVEAGAPLDLAPRWDERHFVLAEASRHVLDDLGVWSRITSKTPITRILGQRAGEFGRLDLRAVDHHVPAFGYTVPASMLSAALSSALAAAPSLTRWWTARVTEYAADDTGATLTIDRAGETVAVRCRLIVAADGAQSTLRSLAGIGSKGADYGQTAIVAALKPARAEPGLALERLSDHGPLAVLPVDAGRCGLIFTLPTAEAMQVLALTDAAFLARLRDDLGDRLGRWLGVGARQAWPLVLTLADRLTAKRLVLIGNAAQSIHPVGAQGFNLGLRDVMALVAELKRHADDPGTDALLHAYQSARADDRANTVRFSHGMVRLTAPTSLAHRLARFAAMTALTHVSPLRDRLARSAMGFR